MPCFPVLEACVFTQVWVHISRHPSLGPGKEKTTTEYHCSIRPLPYCWPQFSCSPVFPSTFHLGKLSKASFEGKYRKMLALWNSKLLVRYKDSHCPLICMTEECGYILGHTMEKNHGIKMWQVSDFSGLGYGYVGSSHSRHGWLVDPKFGMTDGGPMSLHM